MATAELNRLARHVPLDPSRFCIEHDVPVFDEHEVEEPDPDNPSEYRTIRYSRDVLQAMCDTMNARIENTGDYTAICLGHTPTPDERRRGIPQPPLVGFCGPFYVGTIGEKQPRAAIIAQDWGIFHDDVDRARKHPRRSVEVWREADPYERYIEPIALLGAETPRRDLGLAYSMRHSGTQVARYTAMAPSATNTFMPGNTSTDEAEHYETPEQPATEATGMSLSDEDINKIIAAVMELDTTKFVQQLMEQQQAKAPATQVPGGAPGMPGDPMAGGAPAAPGMPGADPLAAPGGAPGGDMPPAADPMAEAEADPMGDMPPGAGEGDDDGGDGLPPDFGVPEGEAPEAPSDDDNPDAIPKDRNENDEDEDTDMPNAPETKKTDDYRRTRADQQRYAQIERYNRKLAADNAELSKRLKAIEQRHTLAERYSKIDALQGVVMYDPAEEYARIEGMNDDQFASHLELMRERYQKDPTGFAPLPTSKPRKVGTDEKTLYAKIEQRANSYVARGIYKRYDEIENEVRKELNAG